MLIIENTTQFHIDDECAVTIGKFDGVHRGHRELLDRITNTHDSELCKQIHNKYFSKNGKRLKSVVFTFDKSPMEFFSGKTIPGLTTKEEKRRIFEYLNVDVLIEFPFNEVTAATRPDLFIKDILVNMINSKYIVAGKDVSYGDRGMGDAELLKKYSSVYDYDLEIIDKLLVDGNEVSSTAVREYVTNGNMELSEKYIGVPYAIYGTIVTGNKIGRRIGFPTINIEVSKDKLMPPYGVYFAEISIDGKHYKGITNVGTKPTVTYDRTVFAETNILDFNEDVYGRTASVKLLHFQRPERRFNNLDELKNQIANDISAGKELFKSK